MPPSAFDRALQQFEAGTQEFLEAWRRYCILSEFRRPDTPCTDPLLVVLGLWREQWIALAAASRTPADLKTVRTLVSGMPAILNSMQGTITAIRTRWAPTPPEGNPPALAPDDGPGPRTLASALRRQAAVEAQLAVEARA